MLGRVIVLGFLVIATTSSAQLLYQDTFSYPDGPLLAAPNSSWVNNYPPTNQIAVVAGKILLTQAHEESVRYNFPKPYALTNLYAGFQVQFSALPTGNGNYFAFFRANGIDALVCRLWTATNGAAPGKFRLGIKTVSFSPAMISTDLSLGVVYDVVMRFDISQLSVGTSTLWINPASESDTSRKAEDSQGGIGYTSYGHFGFKQITNFENHDNGMGDLTVDNLRIGFSFASVRPRPVLTSISRAPNGTITLNGLATPTTNYWVLANTNLNTTNWLNLGNATAATNGFVQFIDSSAPNCPTRFYRLMAQ
jgi:hypothetical protein